MKVMLGAAIGLASLVVALGATAGSTARARFEPQWLTALSAKEFWVVGKASALHTTDGGRHFHRLGMPPVTTNLQFADSQDGFAYGWRSPLFSTHDGGKTWHRVEPGDILAFATGAGTAYAVTGRCKRDGSCRDLRFERSATASDAWRAAGMPFARATPNFDLAALGADLWLFGGSSSGRYRLANVLARSNDHGRTFAVGHAPCYADLAAELDPVSSRVVWAFCPTGLMGLAWRSSDGGATFKGLSIPHCCENGSWIAAASDDVAVLASVRGILRTTDGGVTWRFANAPRNGTYAPIEFVDARNGFALGSIGAGRPRLWRTDDAGGSWHAVPIR
jgi:hypothetical protein